MFSTRKNIRKLTSSIVQKAKEICPNPNILLDADNLRLEYEQLFVLFARCHNTYKLALRMSDKEIEQLGECICII